MMYSTELFYNSMLNKSIHTAFGETGQFLFLFQVKWMQKNSRKI